jgi:hypothetical protein
VKNEGVLEGFIVPLSHAQEHYLAVFSDIELNRADQIPHVFNHENIQATQVKFI